MSRLFKQISIIFILWIVCLRVLVSEDLAINWDAPILINGAYRVFSGQIPHVDFSTPIGPIIFMASSFGMWLTTPSLLGINLGLILFSITLLILCILSMRKHLTPNLTFLLAIFLAAFLFSPRMLSMRTLDYGYTGIYNLYGYAIFFMGALATFGNVNVDPKKPWDSLIKGVYLGVLIATLVFLKNSFGLGLLILCIAYFFVTRQMRSFGLGVFLGLLFVAGIFIGYFQGDTYPFIRDQYFVIQARLDERPFSRPDFIEVFIKKTYIDNLYIIFAMIAAGITMPKLRKQVLWLGSSFLLLGYIFCASIMQWPEHILSSFVAFIIVCYVFQYNMVFDGQWNIRDSKWSLALAIVSIIFVLKFMVIGIAGLVSDSSRLLSKPPPTFSIEGSRKITGGAIDPLVLKNYTKGDKVIMVGENDFLAYQLLQTPPKNTLLFWQNQVTFTSDLAANCEYFSPAEIFKDVTLVALSTKSHSDSTAAFMDIYGNYIKNNFNLVDGNKQTLIYRSK